MRDARFDHGTGQVRSSLARQLVLRLVSVHLEDFVDLGVGERKLGVSGANMHHTIEELSHVDLSIIININRVKDSLSCVGNRSLYSLSTAFVMAITVDSLPLGDYPVAVEVGSVENRSDHGGVLT